MNALRANSDLIPNDDGVDYEVLYGAYGDIDYEGGEDASDEEATLEEESVEKGQDASSKADGWPPYLPGWKSVSKTKVPDITFNDAVDTAWDLAKDEVGYLRTQFPEGVDEVIDFMYGEDSALFTKFKTIGFDEEGSEADASNGNGDNQPADNDDDTAAADDDEDDSSEDGSGDDDDEDDSGNIPAETLFDITEDQFIDLFCCESQQDGFEAIRKEEAKEIVEGASDDFISTCLYMLTGKSSKSTTDKKRADLLKWTQSTRAARVTMFMTRNELEALINDLGLRVKSKQGGVEEFRKRVTDSLQRLEYPDECDDDEQDEEYAGEVGSDPVEEILKSAFMRPRKSGAEEGQRAYGAKGIQMEKPLAKSFIEIVNGSENLPYKVVAMYDPGLVARNKSDAILAYYLRDSSDAVGMFCSEGDENDPDKHSPVPLEIKARVSIRTFNAERNRTQNWINEGGEGDEVELHDAPPGVLFVTLPAEKNGRFHPLMKHLIPDVHERIQLLHHAAVYRSNSVFFVVGKTKISWPYTESSFRRRRRTVL